MPSRGLFLDFFIGWVSFREFPDEIAEIAPRPEIAPAEINLRLEKIFMILIYDFTSVALFLN
jgi:hypothetical protein